LVGENLALLDPGVERIAFRLSDMLELIVERLAGAGPSSRVEVADARVALLCERGLGGDRELAAPLGVQALDLEHSPQLLGAPPFEVLELLDFIAGDLPVASIDLSVRIHFLVEDEPGQGRFGPRDVRTDVADDERHVVGMPLGGERLFARIVGELDHEHQDDEHKRCREARSRSAASTPVEADLVFPVPNHGFSLVALTIWRKTMVPSKILS